MPVQYSTFEEWTSAYMADKPFADAAIVGRNMKGTLSVAGFSFTDATAVHALNRWIRNHAIELEYLQSRDWGDLDEDTETQRPLP